MRYPALKVIIFLHYLLAVLVLLAAVVIWELSGSAMVGVGTVIGAGVGIVGLVAAAEVIKVVIDIEANTRTTNAWMDHFQRSGISLSEAQHSGGPAGTLIPEDANAPPAELRRP